MAKIRHLQRKKMMLLKQDKKTIRKLRLPQFQDVKKQIRLGATRLTLFFEYLDIKVQVKEFKQKKHEKN